MTKRSAVWHANLITEVLKDPVSRAEYEAFKLQLELSEKLKVARQAAHLTQKKVAEKMATHTPVIARLEASGSKEQHSPSLVTLVKYANAVGCHLKIDLVPNKRASKHSHR
ncbi:MAG: helix-turn-helix transcriptional regulator [Gammaproteobacteria bacterium]